NERPKTGRAAAVRLARRPLESPSKQVCRRPDSKEERRDRFRNRDHLDVDTRYVVGPAAIGQVGVAFETVVRHEIVAAGALLLNSQGARQGRIEGSSSYRDVLKDFRKVGEVLAFMFDRE